jgi:hypothetical protein
MKYCPNKKNTVWNPRDESKAIIFILYILIFTGIHNPFDALLYEEPSISDIFE